MYGTIISSLRHGNNDVVVVGGVLEAVRDGGERRWYHGTVDEVRGGGADAKF
jgi:hypothetical protein